MMVARKSVAKPEFVLPMGVRTYVNCRKEAVALRD
jgi:hypothetical protein